ncbi:nitric oxide-sensing transcriptional repressor NsrR [Orbus mooreae]|uniref:nitric oxide-sensing transcriptional repressor NsrR n=1 Tax=Orbus mooreae TaxID=3074107 RepID=UPI00370D6321
MQLSSFTDYSIRVLIYLSSLPKDELTNITTVSSHYNISKNHLVKVVHKLGQLGYIETIQGKNGGIKLKKNPKQINIGKIIRQLEPLELLNCGLSFCHISPACRLKKYLVDAKEAFLIELEKYTIDDLISNNPALINLL